MGQLGGGDSAHLEEGDVEQRKRVSHREILTTRFCAPSIQGSSAGIACSDGSNHWASLLMSRVLSTIRSTFAGVFPYMPGCPELSPSPGHPSDARHANT